MLLEEGARRVYAVDAGHGQLLGSLRQDPRVVNLEAVNVAELDTDLVPDAVEVVTVDVSYLSVGAAVAQLDRVRARAGCATWSAWSSRCSSCARATAPSDRTSLDAALAAARRGVTAAGWAVAGIDRFAGDRQPRRQGDAAPRAPIA